MLLVFSLLLFTISLAQVIWGVINNGTFVDFYAYFGAGGAFLKGRSPYGIEFNTPIGLVNFMYPPGTLPTFAGLSMLPENISIFVFTTLSITVFVLAMFFSFSLLERPISYPRQLIMIAFLLQTFPLKLALTLGQINTFILFFVVVGLWFLKQNKEFASAVGVALAITFKVIPFGLLPVAFIKKRFKWVLFVLAWIVLANCFNFDLALEYVTRELPRLLTPSQPSLDFYNQSLSVLVLRLSGSLQSIKLGHLLFVFFYGLVLLQFKRPFLEQLLLVLPLITLFSHNSWQHHLVLMYPFIIYFFVRSWLFVPIWFGLFFHFSYTSSLLVKLPWLASYQTLLLLGLVLLVSVQYFWKQRVSSVK